jgi:hypothetical protein
VGVLNALLQVCCKRLQQAQQLGVQAAQRAAAAPWLDARRAAKSESDSPSACVHGKALLLDKEGGGRSPKPLVVEES